MLKFLNWALAHALWAVQKLKMPQKYIMDLRQRWVAFLLGCIGIRLLFVIIARFSPSRYLPYLGLLALGPAIGFSYLWLFDKRLIGFEAGGKIWWHSIRIVHALLYFTFSFLALRQSKQAYIPLAIDVTIGLIVFFLHHSLKVFE